MPAKKSVSKKSAPAKKSATVTKLAPAKKNAKKVSGDEKLGQEILQKIMDAINTLPQAKTVKAKATKVVKAAAPKAVAVKAAAPKAATPKAATPKAVKAADAAPTSKASSGSGIQITSSKACQAFAKRANQVKDIVSKARPGASITIDEQKKEGTNPDRGSFVITVGGKTVVELRSMPRPFTAMKALDMEKVAADVINLL
jgi:hypothetical protein